jgi:hypothetical protein
LSRFCHGGPRCKSARPERLDGVWIFADRHRRLTTEAGRADTLLFILKELCTNLRDLKSDYVQGKGVVELQRNCVDPAEPFAQELPVGKPAVVSASAFP